MLLEALSAISGSVKVAVLSVTNSPRAFTLSCKEVREEFPTIVVPKSVSPRYKTTDPENFLPKARTEVSVILTDTWVLSLGTTVSKAYAQMNLSIQESMCDVSRREEPWRMRQDLLSKRRLGKSYRSNHRG